MSYYRILYYDQNVNRIVFRERKGLSLEKVTFLQTIGEGLAVCEQMVRKLPTAVPQAWFLPTLMLSKLVPESTRFASLVDTNNGNGHSRRISVANGIGHCIGETISC